MRNAIAKIVCSTTVALLLAGSAGAAQPGAAPPAKAGPTDKASLLAWIDANLAGQVLFRNEDVKRVRDKVANMNEEEVRAFLQKTGEVRELLESPVWRETNDWLKDFLKVQAIYSDKEVDDLKARIGQMNSDELIEELDKILDRRYRTLRRRNLEDKGDKAAASFKGSSTRSAGLPATGRKYANRTVHSASPAAPAKVRKYNYSVQGPLINSREVARGAVYRSVFRGRRW